MRTRSRILRGRSQNYGHGFDDALTCSFFAHPFVNLPHSLGLSTHQRLLRPGKNVWERNLRVPSGLAALRIRFHVLCAPASMPHTCKLQCQLLADLRLAPPQSHCLTLSSPTTTESLFFDDGRASPNGRLLRYRRIPSDGYPCCCGPLAPLTISSSTHKTTTVFNAHTTASTPAIAPLFAAMASTVGRDVSVPRSPSVALLLGCRARLLN
ncbi:uncharacterized protein SCHCODRAFT_02644653 [Schizophyllum commune H4-8]|uniref:uncharacterized protein n=1 Tax=Schizophyllum commune (strain H4-8 / FGSC 9210) TaxID=578458 RepID=UPI002160B173|nr:uncharacterized protein SCHCODRAFT_02644653 [Schizophyllum commune H4-8]KAI5885401.1 hypothetical protein SCHCODRAFT_02644653 [Schizophyllum commune H4-8]